MQQIPKRILEEISRGITGKMYIGILGKTSGAFSERISKEIPSGFSEGIPEEFLQRFLDGFF